MTETIEYLDDTHALAPTIDLHKLNVALAHSIFGEPFLFCQHSYNDELTLHFGSLRPYKSKRMEGKSRGTHVISVRASGWLIKSTAVPGYVSSGSLVPPIAAPTASRPLSTEQVETTPFITAGTRVVFAEAFPVIPWEGIGLSISFADGASILIRPVPEAMDESAEVADWELRTPTALLRAGPGIAFTYETAARQQD